MALTKCTHCLIDRSSVQFINEFGKTMKTCLTCRLRGRRNDKQPARRNRHPCEKCSKNPIFNFQNETRPRFCAFHKEDGMVNVTSKKCAQPACTKQPCFNLPNELLGKFCATHRTPEMVNVRERRCEHGGCFRKPVYNLPTEKRGRFCKEHCGENMVDVLSLRCGREGCLKRGNFNFPGKPAQFCGTHKERDMIDVKTRRCEHAECTTVPVFNLPGVVGGRFCREHKENGMVDVKNKRCMTSMCDIILTGNSRNYCARCFAYMFPGEKCGPFKTREMKLKEYLESQYSDKTIVHDKHVECHRYRPDFVFDMGSHTIVIELDENQHKTYDTSCDNKRLMAIFQGLGSRHMVMLRFNPDRYDSAPGCFKRDGVLSGNGKEWNTRTRQLKARIDHWMNTQPDREITVEHLFFDTSK